MEEKRYYYKDKQGNRYNYKSEHTEEYLITITKEEFNELTKLPELTGEQKALIEKKSRIAELHKKLEELDYVGVKIATGRATREEYADKIALMSAYVRELNLLEENK